MELGTPIPKMYVNMGSGISGRDFVPASQAATAADPA